MLFGARNLALGLEMGVLFCAASPPAFAACKEPAARIVAIDHSVHVRESTTNVFVPATLNGPVCQGDSIRVGPSSRATVAFVGSGLRLTIEQNTEWAVRPPRRPGRSLIQLLRGAILFITRQPRSLDVETPFVNAAVEGTEFVVRVEGDRASVAVLEGTVSLSNDQGSLALTSGQAGQAVSGQAPQRIDVRPGDAVQWALYYEPLFPGDSLELLEKVPEAERNARFYVRRASVLLGVGRVQEARQNIAKARGLDSNDGTAYALNAIIDVALNDRASALENGRRAVALSPDSIAARLALSYAHQAAFNLEAARAEILHVVPGDASGDRPEHAVALARLAELWLSLGDRDKALAAARRATAVAPDLARTHTVLGFAALTVVDTAGAKAAFQKAIERESKNPLAHLGLGLAKIREGDLAGGRSDIETAAALNVTNPIVRSYLGKAYFEEKRNALAADQLDMAKQLDPLDPTPFFYDAIRKQVANQPVQALEDLEKSVSLNDNRAVYRSRFLLDDDLAARAARTGRVFRDLGFEELALQEGWVSLNADPSNHSAHRLLADSYLVLPRHEIARDSELLQSQLLQPLNINPVQPRLADNGLSFLDDSGISNVGFNEYTRLFAGNQVRVVADGVVGNRDTATTNLILTGIFQRLSYSVGHFSHTSDGIRENQDIRQGIFNGFVQAELSTATSVMAEFRAIDGREGARPLLFARDNFSPNFRSEADSQSIRLGFRQRLTPRSSIIGTYSRETSDSSIEDTLGFDFPFSLLDDAVTDFLEMRYLHGWRSVNFTGGVGYLRDRFDSTFVLGGEESLTSDVDTHANAYFYSTVNLPRSVSITGGASVDSARAPSFLLDHTQVNPKIGVTWTIRPGTLVRGAAFRTLKRFLVASQTIEPTNVAGFNQFFDDGPGTGSWRYGVAVSQSTWRGGYVGAELSYRDNSTPIILPSNELQFNDWSENLARLYFYSTLGSNFAVNAELRREYIDDPRGNNPDFVVTARTTRVPVEARFFWPAGGFGRLRATYARQRGSFLDRELAVFRGEEDFWVVDASLGFRFPKQWGSAAIDVRNLFDDDFNFQDSDPTDPRLIPGRQFLARVTVTF